MMMMLFRTRRIRAKYLKIKKKKKQIAIQRLKSQKSKNWLVISEEFPFKMPLFTTSFTSPNESTFLTSRSRSYFPLNKYPFYRSTFKLGIRYELLFPMQRKLLGVKEKILKSGFLFFFVSLQMFFNTIRSLPEKCTYTFLSNISPGFLVILHSDFHKCDTPFSILLDPQLVRQLLGLVVLEKFFLSIPRYIKLLEAIFFFFFSDRPETALSTFIDSSDHQIKLPTSDFTLPNLFTAPVIVEDFNDVDSFDEFEVPLLNKINMAALPYRPVQPMLETITSAENSIASKVEFFKNLEYCSLVPQIYMLYADL